MIELKPRGGHDGRADPDGIRVVAGDAGGKTLALLYKAAAIVLAAGCAAYVLMPRPEPPPAAPAMKRPPIPGLSPDDAAAAGSSAPGASAPGQAGAGPDHAAASAAAPTRRLTPHRLAEHRAAASKTDDERGPDEVPADLPKGVTMGEYIQALHDAGIHEGIGAFNPPGTKPPLEGLVVPDDYELPEGFVRHYGATDDGQPIAPILMYSPDYEFFDENGQPIPIPEDRVVPPENVPPGFPINPVVIPPPREPGDLSR